ncbi:MAG: ribonuclease E/G [Microthrixaceae bacterium]
MINDVELHEEIRSYAGTVAPAGRRVTLYDPDDQLPMFERFHVTEQLAKALDRKVWLPSGGSLIVESTRPHGDRREHRQERRLVEPRGDRARQQPRRRPTDRPSTATA